MIYFFPCDALLRTTLSSDDSLFALHPRSSVQSNFEPIMLFFTGLSFSGRSRLSLVLASSLGSVFWPGSGNRLDTEALWVRSRDKQSSCHFSRFASIPSNIGCSFLLSFSSAWGNHMRVQTDSAFPKDAFLIMLFSEICYDHEVSTW